MPQKNVKKMEIASDDGVVNLKERDKKKDGPDFQVHKIEDDAVSEPERKHISDFDAGKQDQRLEDFAEKLEKAVIKVSPKNAHDHADLNAKELIRVNFAKFVQLVASRDFMSVLERNKDEDVIMSSNLLAELAGAVDQKGEKKTPVIFLVGLAIGVVITYILISR